MRKIRVLVVDDSLLFREAVSRGISEDASIEVVGKAGDAFEARDKIIELEPDVLTLDVEMPKMSGIEFLKKLLPQYPVPVIVVSSANNNVFEALNAGAVDFVAKPSSRSPEALSRFISELVLKIKIGSTARVGRKAAKPVTEAGGADNEKLAKSRIGVIAIGASTGGTEAILEVVRDLPEGSPGVVIVQHMPPVFTRMYAERLNKCCKMEAKEAADGDEVRRGRILVAPGDFHMRLLRSADGGLAVRCFKGEKVSGHCPSVDVLFESAAVSAGRNAIGVILTGMGYDGAKGLLLMRKAGAGTVGQDERSSVVYGMPKAAFEMGAVREQAALHDIRDVIRKMS